MKHRPTERLMWAVTRDGEIYMLTDAAADHFWRARSDARCRAAMKRISHPQSKWSTCRVRVTPIKNRKRRR